MCDLIILLDLAENPLVEYKPLIQFIMIKKMLLPMFFLGLSVQVSAQSEVIKNQTVLDLLKEGFTSVEVQGLIESSSDRDITFSIDFMRKLKDAGADSGFITYLQKVAKVDHGYEGVLWWNPTDGGKPVKLYRTTFEKENSGGFGAVAALAGRATGVLANNTLGNIATVGLLTSGGGIKKVVMQGHSARVVLKGKEGKQPVFRFYFPKTEAQSFANSPDAWFLSFLNSVESPNEFQCIKMKQKKSKRTFPNGISYTVAGFTAEKSNRNIIDFDFKEISNHVFEVSFKEPLEEGEYCFFYKNATNNAVFAEHMFGFDFSVQE